MSQKVSQATQLLHEVYKHAREDQQIISLMLTEQCNFACSHCFYGCSPNSPKGYMSQEVLDALRRAIFDLNKLEIDVSLNLIGGEPTLNLPEFERIFDWAESLVEIPEVVLEMTTNGWWLQRPEPCRRFLQIVRRAALSYGGRENGFTIRISGDRFHQENRPSYVKMKQMLEELFEYGSVNDEPVAWGEIWECNDCGRSGSGYVDECPDPDCASQDITTDQQEYISLPENDPNDPWIYVEDDLNYHNVIPSGIRGQFGGNELTCSRKHYSHAHALTFHTNGQHGDGCCRGSEMPFGDVNDHPLVLLALNLAFTYEVSPSCRSCRAEAEDWAQTKGKTLKARLYRALPAFIRDVQHQLEETAEVVFEESRYE